MDYPEIKLLIIEDDKSLLRALLDKFKLEGFDVLIANNGEAGLSMALKKKPDLIILDILMPKMDGLTVLEKLREDKWGVKVPIMLLTNVVPDNETIAKITEYKPAFYLVKSDWSIDEIVQKMKDCLQ